MYNFTRRPLFWSYLWGFETNNSVRGEDIIAVGFGVTYEGLKLIVIPCMMSNSGSFGVTYEGLKRCRTDANPTCSGWFWSYLWGFETPQCVETHCRAESVLELPMRVWNSVLEYSPQSSTAFWSYLWGFETGDHRWRHTHNRRFGVTYEGLKPPPPGVYRITGSSFWSYLWGFETGRRLDHVRSFSRVLELPMRVWN